MKLYFNLKLNMHIVWLSQFSVYFILNYVNNNNKLPLPHLVLIFIHRSRELIEIHSIFAYILKYSISLSRVAQLRKLIKALIHFKLISICRLTSMEVEKNDFKWKTDFYIAWEFSTKKKFLVRSNKKRKNIL